MCQAKTDVAVGGVSASSIKSSAGVFSLGAEEGWLTCSDIVNIFVGHRR